MNDVVAVRGGRGEVVEVGVEILREIGAGHAGVGEVGNGSAMRGGDDVVDRLGGGCRSKYTFSNPPSRPAAVAGATAAVFKTPTPKNAASPNFKPP